MQAMGRMLQGEPQQGMPQGHSPDDGHDHGQQQSPVIEAAMKAGVPVEKMLQAGDLRGVIEAAMQADPSLNGPQGEVVLMEFLDQYAPQGGQPQGQQADPQMQAMGKMLQGG
jgi:hypothetical protein